MPCSAQDSPPYFAVTLSFSVARDSTKVVAPNATRRAAIGIKARIFIEISSII
jgi:hypothetical protein